ncbi:type II secretion system protein E [Oscillospiraceae bacterium]|nr:type II secretion system protein E [Oscillospiraceae bacterium]BDF75629.1 type II secretion system protein E [Oscillospiraceae bacterium]
MAYKRLGDLLLSVGLISQGDLERALELQKTTKKRLGKVLTEYGIISERQLIEALELQLGVEFIDLSKTIISPEMAQVLPKSIAKRHNVVPVKIAKDELFLAMSDPLNFVAAEEVKNVTRKRVVPMIATEDAVDRAILTLYGNEGAARAIEEMKREASGGEGEAGVYTTTVGGDDAQAAPTIRLVNSIIERAATERASDIHLEPREGEMVVRMRVDGVLRNVLTVPRNLQGSVLSRLKVMGGMNTAERKIPQDGRANVRARHSDIDLRISTLPTIYGEKMVIRLLDKSAQILSREGIGLEGAQLERYGRLLRSTSGVILIAGPTGSGKSSTMYTMVRELNTEQVNLVTLEDPVEYNIDGVNQCQINEKTGMTFASGLRSILRQDPDIISVGEIRDGETAEIAMRAAITGHLVLSTIHTSDAAATLDRLFDIGVEPYLTASALKGVVAQRLVRRVCPHCRREYEPTDGELELLGMERAPGMKFYRGDGCPMCFHTGYRGRTGVFEILLIGHDVRRLITAHAGREAILAAARGDGFTTLAEHCRALVRAGVTTAEEAARTINSTLD